MRAKGADTCTDCLILLYGLKASSAAIDLDNGPSLNEDDLEELVESRLEEISKKQKEAQQHVHAYQTQRKFANSCISLARMDIANKLPSLFLRHVLTIDMGQNIGLPSFEGEQPGDTYYFSPLTLYLFGVTDNSRSYIGDDNEGHDFMQAYIWHKKDGDRGANNITSCLLNDYKRRGFFSKPNFGSLTVIADNCGGQNKNQDVLRFHLWLVEAGIFPSVKVVFLVKGHTKNACDRLFNLLKLNYHNRNIFTFKCMVKHLNTNVHVDVTPLFPDNFFDFHTVFNRYYRKLGTGGTKRTHVFEILGRKNGESPMVLRKQDIHGDVVRKDDLLPTKRNKLAVYRTAEERKPLIKNLLSELEVLPAPGLKPIKGAEMFSKWRPLLPEWARDETCPYPGDAIMDQIKSERNEKAKRKERSKRDLLESQKKAKLVDNNN